MYEKFLPPGVVESKDTTGRPSFFTEFGEPLFRAWGNDWLSPIEQRVNRLMPMPELSLDPKAFWPHTPRRAFRLYRRMTDEEAAPPPPPFARKKKAA